MELSIKRHRIDSLTTYTMCNELKNKILNTLLIDCNGLLVTTRLGDTIYQYLLSRGDIL